jgi:ATP phosphoribosyltransferase regulatory subunit
LVRLENLIPQGVEDTHSNVYEAKERIISNIKQVFKTFGYRQILTPTFEYYDLFLKAKRTIRKDEMFKLIDEKGEILVLRPDITTPIARMAASYSNQKDKRLKFFYSTNIFRINRENNCSRKEFTQTGIEYIGNDLEDADGEICAAAIECLLKCNITDFKIDLGQAAFFKGLIKEINIDNEEIKKLKDLIENKNFAEVKEISRKLNVSGKVKDVIDKMPYLYGDADKVLTMAKTLVLNKEMEDSLINLQKVNGVICDYGFGGFVSVDLGLINHIDYYTGVIFKGYLNNYGKEVMSGGRYDDLVAEYGHKVPATGMGINVDELIEAMESMDLINEESTKTDFAVLYDENFRKEAVTISKKLRSLGKIVETDKIENKEKYTKASDIIEIVNVQDDLLSILDIKSGTDYKCTEVQFFNKVSNNKEVFSIH